MITTPTGEPLPEYPDDDRGPASPGQLVAWLRREVSGRWGDESMAVNMAVTLQTTSEAAQGALQVYEGVLVRDVLAALQAVGDATLLANGTYRALIRDSRELEALGAYIGNGPYVADLLECDGHAADAAIRIITRLAAELTRLTRLHAGE
jgi:hypothetical protein